MRFQQIVYLIVIATLSCGSAALAGGRARVDGVARPHHSNGAKQHFFVVRRPFPIQQAPMSNGSVGFGASSSRIDSRIDSRF